MSWYNSKTHLPTLFRGGKWEKEGDYVFCTTSKFPNVMDYLETLEPYGVVVQDRKDGNVAVQFPMSMFRQGGLQELRDFIDASPTHVPGEPFRY